MLSARFSRFTSSSQLTPAMPRGALYFQRPSSVPSPQEGLKVPWGDSQVTLDGPALCKHVVTGTQDSRGETRHGPWVKHAAPFLQSVLRAAPGFPAHFNPQSTIRRTAAAPAQHADAITAPQQEDRAVEAPETGTPAEPNSDTEAEEVDCPPRRQPQGCLAAA